MCVWYTDSSVFWNYIHVFIIYKIYVNICTCNIYTWNYIPCALQPDRQPVARMVRCSCCLMQSTVACFVAVSCLVDVSSGFFFVNCCFFVIYFLRLSFFARLFLGLLTVAFSSRDILGNFFFIFCCLLCCRAFSSYFNRWSLSIFFSREDLLSFFG